MHDICQLHRDLPDHEFLSKLARDDPEGYEFLRRELIEDLIDSAPEGLKPRLRGMQFRIDCQRRLSRSPLGLTIAIYRQMWDSFLELNDGLQGLRRSKAENSPGLGASPMLRSGPERSASILEFRQPHKLSEWGSGTLF